jgi:hypothetical protein
MQWQNTMNVMIEDPTLTKNQDYPKTCSFRIPRKYKYKAEFLLRSTANGQVAITKIYDTETQKLRHR